MRAVNLVPSEQRGGGSRTGVAVYVFLGVLGAIAVGLAALVLTNNQIDHRRAELTKAQVKATAAEAEAKALKPYSDFATLRKNRVETVESLAKSRFDWPRVLHDLSRAMPRSAWVQTFSGTVSPGVSAEGGGGGSGLRSALAVPAVELSGCATSQTEVARMMTRLRLIEGVTRVSLGSSQKADASGSTGSTGAGGSNGSQNSGCQSANWPQFNVVLFFENSVPATPTAPTATATAAAGTTTAPTTTGTTTTPAAGQTATTSTTPPASGTQTTPAPTTGATP
jgi:Tfp pilus assembly protein PilN